MARARAALAQGRLRAARKLRRLRGVQPASMSEVEQAAPVAVEDVQEDKVPAPAPQVKVRRAGRSADAPRASRFETREDPASVSDPARAGHAGCN